jgi:hypothetical protein
MIYPLNTNKMMGYIFFRMVSMVATSVAIIAAILSLVDKPQEVCAVVVGGGVVGIVSAVIAKRFAR